MLKKYFVKLVDFEAVSEFIKPSQVIDFDTHGHCGGTIQPIVDLESVQRKVKKIILYSLQEKYKILIMKIKYHK